MAKKAAKKSDGKTIPRQDALPGVGDEKIQAIESAALDYAEVRNERQGLTQREVEVKGRLIDLMHAKKLTEYKRNGISIKLTVEKEKVTVRVKSEGDLEVPDTTTSEGEVVDVDEGPA